MKSSELIHTIFEVVPLITVLTIIVIFFKSRKLNRRDKGWIFILLGFIFLGLGLFVDIFEDFLLRNGEYRLLRTFFETIVGDFLGFLFLIIGFKIWLPKIRLLRITHKRLENSYNKLLNRVNIDDAEAYNAKKILLNRVSHDLRTPLNGIIGCVEIIMGMTKDNEQKMYLEEASRSSEELLRAINNMLDLQNANEDISKVVKSHFKIRNSINTIYKDINEIYHNRKKTIRINIESTVPNSVFGPKIYFEKFFTNFLEYLYSSIHTNEIIINVYSGTINKYKTVLNFQVAMDIDTDLIQNNSSIKSELLSKLLIKIDGSVDKESVGAKLGNSVYNISIPFSVMD